MNKIICTPTISLKLLLFLIFSKEKRKSTIYYEFYSFYIRAIIKIFSISELTISNFFQFMTGFKIKKIPHDESVDDYKNLRLNILIKIANICDDFIPNIKKDNWFFLLENLIDKSVSVASSIKFLAHNQLYIYLLSAKICHKISNKNVILIIPNYWNKDLCKIIKNEKYFSGIIFFKEPAIFNVFNKLNIISKILIIIIKSVFKHGVTFNKVKKKSFKIATEIFDLKLIGASPFDVDFFVDNKTFTYSDSLFYTTSNHSKILEANVYDNNEFKKFIKKNKFNLIELKFLPFPFKFLLTIFSWYFNLFFYSFKLKNSIVFNLLPHILNEHNDYAILFYHYKIKNHIHFINSNGRAPLLLNSSIITGLCRKNNVHSCGIQNRIIDSRQYEFCFDSYDTFFFWGQAWIDVLGSALRFVNKTIVVGIQNLSENIFESNKIITKNKKISINYRDKVIIFPGDIHTTKISAYSGGFYTLSYFIDFIKVSLTLANKYPEIDFLCKPKDKSHIKLFEQNYKLRKLNCNSYNNFKLISKGRMKYMDLLLNSDYCLSIGYTSPGVDAILLNKKSIYYSQLKNAGSAFKQIPNFVAESKDELIIMFDKLLKNKINNKSQILDSLDPYRDGKSIKKIINYLSKN